MGLVGYLLGFASNLYITAGMGPKKILEKKAKIFIS
jgi:hypothetical protein